MDKQVEVHHTMVYHSAIKRMSVLLYATTWINIQRIMLKNKAQPEKKFFLIISLT